MKKFQEVKGTLPGYLPEAKAKLAKRRRLGERRLTVTEEGDMLLAGLSRKDLRNMTPERLKDLADWTAEQSNLLLGC